MRGGSSVADIEMDQDPHLDPEDQQHREQQIFEDNQDAVQLPSNFNTNFSTQRVLT